MLQERLNDQAILYIKKDLIEHIDVDANFKNFKCL
jgi:hypothetical protein